MITQFLLAFLALALGSFVRGVTGFGAALVAIPVLTLTYGPVEAVAITMMVQFVGSIGLVPTVIRRASWQLVLCTAGPLLVTQTIASTFLVSAPKSWLQLVFGILVMAFATSLVLWPVRPGRGTLEELPAERRNLLMGAACFGLLGGVMGGLIGAAGPPIVYFYRKYFADQYFRAQVICVFSLASLSLALNLYLRGVIGWELGVRATMLVPSMAVGLVLGSVLSSRLPRAAFGRVVGVTLLVAGLILAAKGLWAIGQPSSSPDASEESAQRKPGPGEWRTEPSSASTGAPEARSSTRQRPLPRM